MEFNEYQKTAWSTNCTPKEFQLIDAVLGISGEAGEISEKFKKLYRDKGGVITNEFIEDIKKEGGDLLWYIADLCTILGIEMNDVAITNNKKLADRKARGVICGNGDNR